jgi:hypothetical protein
MGKVGSTSVVSALQRIFPAQRIHQTHLLSDEGVLRGMEWWLDQPNAPRVKMPDHLLGSIDLGRQLADGVDSADWYLICLVREPLGRNVSAFFQDLHRQWLPHLPTASREICTRVLKGSSPPTEEEFRALVSDLATVFEGKFPHGWYDRWFEEEMRAVFGIDVFAEEFPMERGFQIYRHGTVRMLLLRIEDLPRIFDVAVREWRGGSPFEAAAVAAPPWQEERSNDAGTKSYADLYRAFLDARLVSPNILATVGESRTACHFYTPAERAEFRSRWEGATPVR